MRNQTEVEALIAKLSESKMEGSGYSMARRVIGDLVWDTKHVIQGLEDKLKYGDRLVPPLPQPDRENAERELRDAEKTLIFLEDFQRLLVLM